MKTLRNFMMMALWCILSSNAASDGVLIRISSSDEIEPYTTGYMDCAGNIVIPMNKYVYCFTEVFDKIAIVLHKAPGDTENHYYAIDRAENILFRVASWDNAPDEVRDGLFRIIVDNKMGFANMNGEVVIQPVYSMALPFSEGLAAFCIGGEKVKIGDYTAISGGKWGFIDTDGTIVITAQFDNVGSFCNGKAAVKKDGVSYTIDKKGNRIN